MVRLLPLLLLLAAACGETPPAADGAPVAARAPHRLEAVRLVDGETVVMDGSLSDAAWKRAKQIVVPLTGGDGGPEAVKLKALHDGETLYLLAIWDDPTMSANRYWELVDGKWEEHGGEDSFAVCWSPGRLADAFRAQACALSCHDGAHVYDARRGVIDFWFWGAQQTRLQHQARDLALRAGERRIRGDGQPADSDNIVNLDPSKPGPKYVPFRPNPIRTRFLLATDEFQELPHAWREQLSSEDNRGWQVVRELLRPMKGSRGDVAAFARHHRPAWVLEMSRALRTGHPDDQPLGDPLRPSPFAVAICDGTEGAAHAVSEAIDLVFLTEEPS